MLEQEICYKSIFVYIYDILYHNIMRERILNSLRDELITRTPLDSLPEGVWKRVGALNTWGTNAIEGNTLTWREVERSSNR